MECKKYSRPVRITEVPDSQKTWGDPSGGEHRGKGVTDTNDYVENIQAARGSCTAQEREPIVYNKHEWNMSSNKKKAHLPRLCTARLAGARSWFCSTAPTSFHTRVYSLPQGRQDPGHHMTKAGTLQPAVGGGASGAIPSPVSRSCCPSSSSCLFPAPLFTDPKDLPSSQTGSQNQTPCYSLRLGAQIIPQANTSPNSSGTSARPLRDLNSVSGPAEQPNQWNV